MSKEVIVYTFETCPYCVKVKRLLDNKGVKFKEVEISGQDDKLAKLKDKTGCGTVPQVFVDDTFIGGYDDVFKLHKEGKFDHIFM